MFNFMKKGAAEREEKEKRKKEKKERKENKKRDRGSMTTEELLRLDEVRRSLKIRGRRKEKEKLPSGITADYTASFFAGLEHGPDYPGGSSSLPGHHLSGTPASPSPSSGTSSSWVRGGGDALTQSDSSEASLTSLNNPTTSNPQQRSLPPLPPRPPKRGILKGPRLSTSSTGSGSEIVTQNGENHTDSSSVLVRNTLQNEVIAYQNVPQTVTNYKQVVSTNVYVMREVPHVAGDGILISSVRNNIDGKIDTHHISPVDSSRASEDFIPSSMGSGDQNSYLTPPITVATNIEITNKLLTVTSTSPSADSLTDTTTTNSSFATPPFSLSPIGESQGFASFHNRWNRYSSGALEDLLPDLPLPPIIPVPLPKPRVLTIQRQPPPRGDFGFSLRRAMVVERLANGQMKAVIFAEPGTIVQHNNETGLLPGDRLLEVNGVVVDDKSREEIIDLIKSSGASVTVKVQPVPELSELTRRSALDGSTVELDDANIRGGTLRRSGSRRFNKNTTARSEEQLANERAWLEAERLWLVHRGGFTACRRLPEENEQAGDAEPGKVRVRAEATSDSLAVDDDDVEKANPPQFDRAEDLSHLRYVNESSVLHTLRQRYGSNLIHTYAGGAMVVVNPMAPLAIYSEKVVHMFRGCKSEDMPPHIYSLAQSAYRSMLASRRDQSIVLLGRSGTGKTINFKHVLHYLVVAAGAVNKVITVEKLNAIGAVMEAFGNSRTGMNSNATRFTQIFSLDFDQSGQIASASLQVLLAERSRVARRPNGEPTFHIFYRLLAGVEGALRKELFLDSCGTEQNIFMTPLQKHEDKQKAMLEFNRVRGAMVVLGITDTEAKVLWSVVAAIYHLGLAGAVKAGNSSSSRWQFASPRAAQHAAQLLGTSVEELARVLFGQGSGGMGTPSTPRTPFRTPSPTDRGNDREVTGLEALEGLVVGLYGEVFSAVGALINRSISTPIHTVSSLVVVDAPGFQNPASCGQQGGATFEDLCHNYLQERLQLLFHHTMLVAPRDRYAQEHIECQLDECNEGEADVEACSPGPLVSLLDRTSQNAMVRTSQTDLRCADRRGLLWLLDEEAVYPGASDEGFLERLFAHYGDRDHQILLRKAPGNNQFVLQHLQGTNPVLYTATGWLKASRENPIARNAATLLQESSKEEVSQLFVSIRGTGVSSTLGGSVVGIEGTQSLRRASSIRRTFTTGTAGMKRKSVCLQVKFTVDGLIETLRRTRLKFVHCFLPQHNAGLSDSKGISLSRSNSTASPDDVLLNVPLVRSQLRGAQVLDAVRLHKQGFPKFLPLSEFRRRFRLLAPVEGRPTSPVLDERRAVEDMLLGIDIDGASYRVGLSQIFFRSGVLAQLEAQRDERLTDHVVRLQARCRGYLARRRLVKLKIQDLAVRCIQRNVRKFMSVRDWPWWRLLVRVTPLLNVHRTEEELRIKTEELEMLRAKVEKLEQERGHLKHDTDRLEAKLSEMTADLAEEHSTATLATERLEAETSERLRLEKELQEVQHQNKNLHQQGERLEMELLYMRAADMNGVGSDEEEDGETDAGVYKQRYERAVRELEFTRRRMQQQHEDDLEQLVGLKKQLEKKLSDAYEEVEEQRQVVGQWKRKVQKLNAETNDLRLLLEEQSSRNNLLEKKQRKFDSELQLLQDELRQEKQQKERLSREKEMAIAEKYTMEQNLGAVRLELELKEERVSALSQELDELMFGGKTEEEVAHLKKAKHELDKKVKEQEEELDDLAGQVQLLEQAKLRLEMSLEQQRKENRREMAQRDDELEDVRCNAHKKVKALEAQLESEHEERTLLLREKHELERRLGAMEEQERTARATDEDQLHRLRRDLRRTKALLRDAQTMLERARGESPGKALMRQLRNQLEDTEFARSAAVKARQSAELELQEVQAQLEESSRARSEAEERGATAGRERTELRTQLEENEEELAEVLKKYRAAVQQLSVDQLALQEQAGRVAELESERATLREQLAELGSRLESMETLGDPSSSLAQKRLELRAKELESKLELEQTTRSRLEVQITRLKEAVEKLQDEVATARAKEQTAQDTARKLQRSLRELREEHTGATAREAEAQHRRRDIEKRLETAEAEAAAARGDLRLALTRIEDLQSAMQGELEDDLSGSEGENSESDHDSDASDESINTFLANHKVRVNSSPRATRPSLELDIASRSFETTVTKKPTDSSTKESFA